MASEAVSIIDYLAVELLEERVSLLEAQLAAIVRVLGSSVLRNAVEEAKLQPTGCGGSR